MKLTNVVLTIVTFNLVISYETLKDRTILVVRFSVLWMGVSKSDSACTCASRSPLLDGSEFEDNDIRVVMLTWAVCSRWMKIITLQFEVGIRSHAHILRLGHNNNIS